MTFAGNPTAESRAVRDSGPGFRNTCRMRLPRPCSLPASGRAAAGAALPAGLRAPGPGPGVNSPSLTPADSNRDRLVGHLLVPSLARTYATVDALRGQGALPFGSAELRSMLAARLNIPVEVLDVVDTTQPLALALVTRATRRPGDPGMLAGACTLKPAEAAAAAAVLGAPASSQKDAQEFRRPDGGSLWVLRSGLDLRLGRHARSPGRGGRARRRRPGRGGRRHRGAGLPAGAGPLARRRTRQRRAGLKAKAAGGLRSQLPRARPPRPAGRRARRLRGACWTSCWRRCRTPTSWTSPWAGARPAGPASACAPRPGRARRSPPGWPRPRRWCTSPRCWREPATWPLAAIGPSPALLELYQGLLDAQARAGVTGAAAIAARVRALAAQLSGAMTTSARAAGNGTTRAGHRLSLRPGASPAAALDALVALARDPALPPLLQAAYGSQAPAVTAARENTDAGPGRASSWRSRASPRARPGRHRPQLLRHQHRGAAGDAPPAIACCWPRSRRRRSPAAAGRGRRGGRARPGAGHRAGGRPRARRLPVPGSVGTGAPDGGGVRRRHRRRA